jgi:hypothetical protein
MVFTSTQLDNPLSTAMTLPNQSSLLSDGLSVNTANRSVAFIDTKLADYQLLAQGLQAGTAVYELNSAQNEISQITQVLAGYQDLSQVAIFSHGRAGAVQLGNLTLDSSDLGFYSQDLQVWGKALAANASLALYGCEVAAGEVGQAFVNQLHQWLGADVAASTDLTGSAALNGNWTLEYATGAAPVSALQTWAEGYNHVLATFVVSNTDDDGEGSLRDAVAAANDLTTEANTIVFQLAGEEPPIITLTSGQLQITGGELAIQGPGADWLTISGNDVSRVFQVDQGAFVTLAQLTVANGRIETALSTDLGGGGILNNGTLTLLNSTVTNNVATSTAPAVVSAIPTSSGGGIYNAGTLQVINSRVTNNQVIAELAGTATYANALGGGIYTSGALTVDNSLIADNQAIASFDPIRWANRLATGGQGGGIYQASFTSAFPVPVTLINSQLRDNSATFGGALYGTATVNDSRFVNNSAAVVGNAIYVTSGNRAPDITEGPRVPFDNGLRVTVSNSQFMGGGIYVNAGRYLREASGKLTVNNSQFMGDGILNVGNTIVSTSQFSGGAVGIDNASLFTGGAMRNYAQGSLTVDNSQFMDNQIGIINQGQLTVRTSQFIHNSKFGISVGGWQSFPTGNFTAVQHSQFISTGINNPPPPFPGLPIPLTVIDSQFIDT